MKSWNSGKGRNINKLTKELLHQKIEVEGCAISRLAKELDCNRNSIQIKMKEYGIKPLSKEQILNSQREQMIKKFGGPSPFSSQKVQETKRKTLKEKYGVENISQVPEINEKIQKTRKETMQRKYGKDSYMQTSEFRQKTAQTNLEKFGDITPLTNEEVKQKIRKTMRKKYNVDYNWQRQDVREKAKQTCIKKFGVDNPFKSLEIQEQIQKTLATTLKRGFSKQEKDVCNFIKSIYFGKIKENDRRTLQGPEIDILLPDLKIGIEYNGSKYHSLEMDTAIDYHKLKTQKSEEKGIRLIQIYDWEWLENQEKIKEFIRFCITNEQVRIYARQCEVRNVDRKIYHDYCRKNHLQGTKSGTNKLVVLGLYYKDELVQLMSFDKPARSKKYQWEIIRGCPGSMNHVIGGNSKLFKHFIRKYNPDNVMSKCDMDKFDGRGYYAMGMKLVKWDYRIYDVFIKEGHLKATSYHPRQEKNRIQREIDMKNGRGYHVSSAGTAEFVWTKE